MNYDTKAEALEAANRVAKELGHPWRPHVSENLGWHAQVFCLGGYLCGGLTCYIHEEQGRRKHYSVMGIDRTLGEGRTPRSAVRNAAKTLRKAKAEIGALLRPLESC